MEVVMRGKAIRSRGVGARVADGGIGWQSFSGRNGSVEDAERGRTMGRGRVCGGVAGEGEVVVGDGGMEVALEVLTGAASVGGLGMVRIGGEHGGEVDDGIV
jgi:hypothetical protein